MRHGAIVDPDELARRLVDFGYRREELVEHRGEFARRGAIIDVFPSTGDAPVRIDLWGDEVDRLTTFGVNDQRSVADVPEALIFPARELLPSDELRQRASRLVAREPWGREQWERIAEGAFFEGMESWLPWLDDNAEPTLLTDVLPDSAKVVLVEPRRSRDRAVDLLAEEDDLAAALASTWGRERDLTFPRLHAEPDRLLAGGRGAFWSIDSAPESPDTPIVESSGWGPVAGDGAGLARRLAQLISEGYRVVVAADGAGSATRLREVLARSRRRLARRRQRHGRPGEAGWADHRRPAASRRHVARGAAGDRRRERSHRSSPRPPAATAAAPRRGRGLRGSPSGHVRRPLPPRCRPLRGDGQALDRRCRAGLPAARLQGQRQALRAVRPDRHPPPVRRW